MKNNIVMDGFTYSDICWLYKELCDKFQQLEYLIGIKAKEIENSFNGMDYILGLKQEKEELERESMRLSLDIGKIQSIKEKMTKELREKIKKP